MNKSASLFDLAAAYSYGLARNHPFADGNKRTAFVVGVLFLELNGYRLQVDESEATRIFQVLAAGEVEEHELSGWFKQHSVSLKEA
ncbi:MAG: type II toxin-antitoxin system death-on-curing family toxin [Gammaproteobacteria bacterium]|nr:type II toxin-antitoxin system death-on-curing family toxin [Gammaproteobacteria bacterium]